MDQSYVPEQEEKGSILRGLIGALLGGLVAAVVAGIIFIIMEEFNFVVGFGLGFTVGSGYKLLKGRKGAPQVVIGVVCSLLAMLLATGILYVSHIEEGYADVVKPYNEAKISKDAPIYPKRADYYDACLQNEEFTTAFKKDLGLCALFIGIPAIIAISGFYFDDQRKGEVPVEEGAPNAPGGDNAA